VTPFEIESTPIAGLAVLRRSRHTDNRGYLERLFQEDSFSHFLGHKSIVQMNHTLTHHRGTIRGMHCQLPPHAECKVVTCVRGSVFDVVVDLRATSDTFGQWWGYELSEKSGDSLIIPEGCAHGFQTLQDSVNLVYMHTSNYAPAFEAAVNPLSSELAIRWATEVRTISDRDQSETRTLDWFKGVTW